MLGMAQGRLHDMLNQNQDLERQNQSLKEELDAALGQKEHRSNNTSLEYTPANQDIRRSRTTRANKFLFGAENQRLDESGLDNSFDNSFNAGQSGRKDFALEERQRLQGLLLAEEQQYQETKALLARAQQQLMDAERENASLQEQLSASKE